MDVEEREELHTTREESSETLNYIEDSPTKRFSRTDKELGHGAYKRVYLAFDHETGKEVAWNTVRTQSMTNREKERVLEEIKLYQQLDHPNILKMIKAWRNRAKDEVVMITELMTSSLKEYIHKNSEHPRLKVIKSWCKSILKALDYFHSRTPPVIHRDLKCDNIFISSSNAEIRIGDLGFSTTLKESHLRSQVGTPYFMAPEMYEERYGASVDIYSFGLCVIEMCTLSTPYSECKNQAALLQKLKKKEKPEAFEQIKDEQIKDFISLCILPAEQRPTAKELLEHDFLKPEEEDFKTNEPVFVVMDASKEEKKPRILELITEDLPNDMLNVVLLLKNPDQTNFRIEFKFNPNTDVPEQIVEELLQKVDTSPETLKTLLEALESKIINRNSLKKSEQTTPRFSEKTVERLYELSIKLGVQDGKLIKNYKVDFHFDTEKDSSEGIAEEIVQRFELDPEDYQKVLNLVQQKVKEVVKPSQSIPYMDLLDMYSELTLAPTKTFNSTGESVASEIKSMSSSKGSEVLIRAQYVHREDPFSGNLSPISSFTECKYSPAKSDEEEVTPKNGNSKNSTFSFGLVPGRKIVKIKKALGKLLFLELKIGEDYDKDTERAVKMFQGTQGLGPDGVLTQNVYDLIMSNTYTEAYKCTKKKN